jgi:hypothetical protein
LDDLGEDGHVQDASKKKGRDFTSMASLVTHLLGKLVKFLIPDLTGMIVSGKH